MQIVESTKKGARFSLVVTMNPSAVDDGFLTRNGVIDGADLVPKGTALIYRSSEGEPSLGTCVLAVRSVDEKRLRVSQSGKCWWFGEGVDASGLYELAK